jgi:Fe-only nitrogenase accessory protein AnfO
MCIQEIASIIGPDGGSIPISEPGMVVVYRRVRGSWEKDREMAFAIEPARGLRDLRNKVDDLKALLRDCRVFVAKSASGALFFELEKARFSVWEISGTPAEFLESVWLDERSEQTAAAQPHDAGIPAPTETFPGRFTISIREIQGKRPEISSKQVLQDFVRKGAFEQLEVICDHMPPWIEVDATRCGFEIETETIRKNEVKVRLTKNARGGCC